MDLVIDKNQSYEKNLATAGEFFRTFLLTSFAPTELSSILKKNLTVSIPSALAYTTWSLGVDHPSRIEAVMSKLKSTFEEVGTLEVPDGVNGPEGLFNLYLYTFGDMITTYGHYNPDQPGENRIFVDADGEAPKVHPIITSSFLTAATRKLDFMKIGDWYSMTLEGLQMGEYKGVEDKDVQEINAIAALVFFAILGAEQFASTMYSPALGETYDTVLNALKELKKRNIVRYKPAVALLERVVSDVEKRDRQERSVEEVWRELFVERRSE
ncbi:hypothetical protein EST38_g1689 [Candolleomyces aberdarensis]|uniref:Uncharacterized protein n=1 Tax=Candolleomyces aberdarensis TaxID=2316362 RepID=A0A4Q2DXH9_9AGAR|nr:hypothetical protein EST38_g1689 [Candolleomyces aberdarensis]